MSKHKSRSARRTSKTRRSAKGTKSRARRHNPLASLLPNPAKSGARKSGKRRRSVSLAKLLSRVGNPKHHKRGATKSHRKSHHKGHKRARRHNPLLVNPATTAARRSSGGNPVARVIGKLQSVVRGFPLVGTFLGGAVGAAGSTLGGAVGVLPTSYAMKYVGRYFPNWLKPYGYSVAGMALSGLIRVLPFRFMGKEQLAIGVAAAGGAVDVYRKLHNKSDDLSGYGSLLADGEMGEDEVGDGEMGEDFGDLGDSGEAFAAIEFADASLADAELCGSDFSSVELSSLLMGRADFRRRFFRRGQISPRQGEGSYSDHAELPGRQWGWLLYWIGADNAKKVAELSESERKEFIKNAKIQAQERAASLLAKGLEPTMQQAETAGLLVAA